MEELLPPIVGILRGNISDFSEKMAKARHEAADVESTGGGHFKKFGMLSTAALGGIATAALGVGTYALHMADKWEEAHARVENAIKNTHGNIEELSPAITALDKRMEHYNFTNADTESGLAGLIRVTGDSQKAIGLMSLAADIARGRHIDLGTATNILMKVETGHVALLGKLGIATKDASGKTISQGEAIKKLGEMYGGSAAQYQTTFSAKMEHLKVVAEDLGAKLGRLLIPFLEKLAVIISKVVDWMEKHKKVAIALAIVIGDVLTGGISTLVLGIILLASKWQTIWHGIEHVTGAVVAAIVSYFRIVLDIWMDVVGGILHGAAAAFGWVPGVGGKLKAARDAFDNLHAHIDDTFTNIADQARGWGSSIGKGIAKGLDSTTGQVSLAASKVAGAIARNTRVHSPADEGPLSQAGGPEGWGARFAELYARGISGAVGTVRSAAARAAGATLPQSIGTARTAAGTAAAGAAGGNVYQLHATFHVEGTRDPNAVAKVIWDYVRAEFLKAQRNGSLGLAAS